MELQVLIHSIDVVEDVLDDSGDDPLHVVITKYTLKQTYHR